MNGAAELKELIDAVEKIAANSGKIPAVTILRSSVGAVSG
jgi:hypothetical protein